MLLQMVNLTRLALLGFACLALALSEVSAQPGLGRRAGPAKGKQGQSDKGPRGGGGGGIHLADFNADGIINIDDLDCDAIKASMVTMFEKAGRPVDDLPDLNCTALIERLTTQLEEVDSDGDGVFDESDCEALVVQLEERRANRPPMPEREVDCEKLREHLKETNPDVELDTLDCEALKAKAEELKGDAMANRPPKPDGFCPALREMLGCGRGRGGQQGGSRPVEN